MEWRTSRRTLTFDRPLVMGIVNVTPDSFSDGGQWFDTHSAVGHALHLVAGGTDILDIGGESTRPGAIPVSEADELRRVVTVVAALVKQVSLPISIDTMKPAVARACIDAGAEIVNDVSGLRDPGMVEVVRDTKAGVIVMHMPGTPKTMQDHAQYGDVVADVGSFFEERLRMLGDSGIAVERVALDPGIGFGKKSQHNWQLLAGLHDYRRFGRPMCLGVSRKGFLGKDRESRDRMIAGLAVACHGIVNDAVQIVRTHDVKATRDAIDALASIRT
jgi:dihydropteroate synthase